MKILILLPYIPYPLDNGGNNAVFYMIDHFRKEFDISILLDVTGNGFIPHVQKNKLKNANHLINKWPEVTFYLYKGTKKRNNFNSFYCKTLRFLEESFARKHKRAQQKIEQEQSKSQIFNANSLLTDQMSQFDEGLLSFIVQTANKGFDIIQVEMYEYLHLGYILPPHIKKIFIHHELRFIRVANEICLLKSNNLNTTLLYEQNKMNEIAALNQFDRIITLSKNDKEILSEYIPEEKIIASPATILPNINHLKFKPCADFVFVGSGKHMPNYDAMVWFAETIWPHYKKISDQETSIYIVGRWDKEQIQVLKNLVPEITFTGYIENLSDFLNGKISIVPLRIGSGIRVKIIEATLAYSPVISTKKGMEGIELKNLNECLITDDPIEFAKYMQSLQNNKKVQQEIAEDAHTKIEKFYDFKRLFSIRKQMYSK